MNGWVQDKVKSEDAFGVLAEVVQAVDALFKRRVPLALAIELDLDEAVLDLKLAFVLLDRLFSAL